MLSNHSNSNEGSSTFDELDQLITRPEIRKAVRLLGSNKACSMIIICTNILKRV